MQDAKINPIMQEEFLRRADLVARGASGKVPWSAIRDLHAEDYFDFRDLSSGENAELSRLAVIKLNGGLGTSMGLERAKSLIEVKPGLNFLQIIMRQIQALRQKSGQWIPLFFMNSYNTRSDTLALPGILSFNGDWPVDFVQHKVPRLLKDNLLPLGDGQSDEHWCPPGHGDVYFSLMLSGLLDRLLAEGREIAFISNGDNLGATAHPGILHAVLEQQLDFLMEVTPKTRADLKGGVLYRHRSAGEERIELLETAMVEPEHIQDFEDVKRFAYFSTNNLWIRLEALRDQLKKGLPLALIVNPKKVAGQEILQLEAAMGSAIGHFMRTRGLIIPRDRFAPVKSCADLLVRRSDAYTLMEDSQLVMERERLRLDMGEPRIVLSDHYKTVKDFESLFLQIPSLSGIASLEIQGPVLFDKKMTLRGTVRLENQSSVPRPISSLGRDLLSDESVEIS
ncbi:MAG: UTP--glucose-1-phosphate uridylyltransferase [Spirochaetales bacterium]|nr:UTP--glucose-1-phosphate uridylyltransferase [Spirochaetales bacterium]